MNYFLRIFVSSLTAYSFSILAIVLPYGCKSQISGTSLSSKDYTSFLQGKFKPDTCAFFQKIASNLSDKTDLYLQKETLASFEKMYKSAKEAGVMLKIVSATRNFDKQKAIWNTKWKRADFIRYSAGSARAKAIMKFSSMPGTSRHHWGTDIDLNDLNNSYFTNQEGKKMYDWMVENASKFGFCQVYSAKSKSRPEGYEEEKWHWSYMPLSKIYTKDYATYIKPEMAKGFEGSNAFNELKVIDNYVKGINPDCK